MSGDAHQLDRDVLRRKDREQLVAIASQLGLKAPARARKDQIIDLIVGDPVPADGSDNGAGPNPAGSLPFADTPARPDPAPDTAGPAVAAPAAAPAASEIGRAHV